MAYNEFSFDLLKSRFGVSVLDAPGIFRGIAPVASSAFFREQLKRNLPLISGVDTEKVRSELLIAPLFSGTARANRTPNRGVFRPGV